MRQFFQSALKGAVLGGVIGGVAILVLAGGHTENAVMGAFVGALVGALFGMRAHTPSQIHSQDSHIYHHMRHTSGVHYIGSADQGPTMDSGGFDGGSVDGGAS